MTWPNKPARWFCGISAAWSGGPRPTSPPRPRPSPTPTAPASASSSPPCAKRFPADGIIGEENDAGDAITFECPDPHGRVWVIDPIDGTNNFIGGLEAFGVCIALLDKGMPVVGVVL